MSYGKKVKLLKQDCLDSEKHIWVVGKGCFEKIEEKVEEKKPSSSKKSSSPKKSSTPKKSSPKKSSWRKIPQIKLMRDCNPPNRWISASKKLGIPKGYCEEPFEEESPKHSSPRPSPPRPSPPKPSFKPSPPKDEEYEFKRITGGVVIGDPYEAKSDKFAVFDYDGTLVTPKGSHPFTKSREDWQYKFPNIKSKLQELLKDGYSLAIRSDQSKSWKLLQIKDVLDDLNLPIVAIISTDPEYNKPNPNLFIEVLGPIITIDKSFFVGDAAGRESDWSSVDKDFAEIVGLKFYTPEKYFGYSEPVDTTKIPSTKPKEEEYKDYYKVDEVVIMTGLPGAGKSTWISKNIPSYFRLSGDQLKLPTKMIKVAEKAYTDGERSFVFDATNVTPEHRAKYIEWAKSKKLPSKCVFINVDAKLAVQRLKIREEIEGKVVPPIAVWAARKKLVTPSESEGCSVEIYTDTGETTYTEKPEPKPAAKPSKPVEESKYEEKRSSDKLAKNFSAMLANKWTDQNIDGWFLSEKLDGVRSIWDTNKFISRNNIEFTSPTWYKNWFPEDTPLDGEFFTKRNDFSGVTSIVRKIVPVDSEWKDVKYMAFDLPADKNPFEVRYEKLKDVVAKSCMGDKDCPIEVVEQIKVKNKDDMLKRHKDLTKLGAEGSMLRKPGSLYEFKRVNTLLKVKDVEETDAVVVGMENGTGKYENVMGKLIVELVDDRSITFKVGSGFTDEDRQNAKKLFKKGTIINVQYAGLTSGGKPRFPIYKGIHIDR